MAIDKINTGALGSNLEIPGTEGARMPIGTTAQRASAQAGDLRFNSTISLMEYYDGTQWKAIDAPPTVSSISPSNISDTNSSVDIVITGTNFSSGATAKAIGQDASEITATTIVVDSTTQITATFDGTDFVDAQEDYDIKVIAASGLSASLDDSLSVNVSPAWTVSAGTLATIYDSARSSLSITTGATDADGDSLTYSVSVGSLPSGLSISSSTGTITGSTSAVGSDTTSTFTLSVTDGTNTTTRQYSILQKAPTVTSYTSTGSGTFTVPTGVSTLDVLVVAGGGGAGHNNSGGGGAGGLIYRPAFPVTPGGSVSYTVGNGGSGSPDGGSAATNGQDSAFGTLTAKGGGRTDEWAGPGIGYDGGSGGGAPGNPVTASVPSFGQATQPQQPGDSGSYGFGNPGGYGVHTTNDGGGGGGGGAGTAGQGISGHSYPQTSSAAGTPGGNGGAGKQYDISGSQVYYAGGGGGGGGGSDNPLWSITGGQGGQGGGGFGGASARSPHAVTNAYHGHDGVANRGGGGGGGDNSNGGSGGSGIVIVKY